MPTITVSPKLVYDATVTIANTYFTSPNVARFKNSLGTTLIQASFGAGGIVYSMAQNGYAVLSAAALSPSNSGTIAFIEFSTVSSIPLFTLVVGGIGSGADVELDNRDVVSGQLWQMVGTIRFRVPNSITYSL